MIDSLSRTGHLVFTSAFGVTDVCQAAFAGCASHRSLVIGSADRGLIDIKRKLGQLADAERHSGASTNPPAEADERHLIGQIDPSEQRSSRKCIVSCSCVTRRSEHNEPVMAG